MPNGRFFYRDFGGFGSDLKWRDSFSMNDGIDLPFVRSVERDYHQSDDKAFKLSAPSAISTFFNAGFVFNLDRNIQKWITQGKLDATVRNSSYLEKRVFTLIREMAIEIGIPRNQVPTSRELSQSDQILLKLLTTGRRMTEPTNRRVSCRIIF